MKLKLLILCGGLLLPQDLDSEGMAVFRYRVG